MTDPVAAELGYLKACIETTAAAPEAFDLAVLLPRIGRAVAAVEAALKLANKWDAPFGIYPVMNIHEEHAADLRAAVSAALLGKENGDA